MFNKRLEYSSLLYYGAVDAQQMVDRFAELAQLRIAGLVRLKDARHIYEPTPGKLNSKVTLESGAEITFNKTKVTSQPYRTIERFIPEDRVMQFVIDPGLLPLATAMSKDMLGRKFLVTRRIASKDSDKGVVAHVDGYGIKIMMHFDEATSDTTVTWECLYGSL